MKNFLYTGLVALALIGSNPQLNLAQSAPAQAAAVGTPLSPGATFVVPTGQKFIMQLDTAMHTRTTRKGDKVEFSTAADVVVDNRIVIPNQSRASATVTKVKRAGVLFGKAELHLRLDEIRLPDGSTLPLPASITRVGFDPVDAANKGEDQQIKGDAGKGVDVGGVVTGGMQGAVIGVVTAGGKGALYGAAIGAGINAASVLFRRGPDIDLPRDTMFEAQFDQPLEIPEAAVRPVAPASPSVVPAPPATPVQDEVTSPPRPKLTRPDRGDPPPVENPPTVKPPETPPATPAKPPVSVSGTQPEATSGLKLKVNVRTVLVDAVVKDRTGRTLDNLTRDDFLIYEDGVRQDLSIFARDELPLAVALVIDRSGSVAPYISELRRIAESALAQLKPEDEVALFSFAGDVDRIVDLTSDRQQIAHGIARVRSGGGTNIIDALHTAVAYLAQEAPDLRHAVILISDNEATVQPASSEAETIRKAIESETVVYSIKTAGRNPPLSMRLPSALLGAGPVGKVTQETGGEIIDATSVAALDAALGGVIARLRTRYSLGYAAPAAGQGAFHTIAVRLADRFGKPGTDYYVHARRGYYATAGR